MVWNFRSGRGSYSWIQYKPMTKGDSVESSNADRQRCGMRNNQVNGGINRAGRATLAAVIAAMVFTAAPLAWAQQSVNTGNVRDANNRIGAGGSNNQGGANRGPYVGVSGNAVITGNVTAGKELRGTVPYTDPRAFR